MRPHFRRLPRLLPFRHLPHQRPRRRAPCADSASPMRDADDHSQSIRVFVRSTEQSRGVAMRRAMAERLLRVGMRRAFAMSLAYRGLEHVAASRYAELAETRADEIATLARARTVYARRIARI